MKNCKRERLTEGRARQGKILNTLTMVHSAKTHVVHMKNPNPVCVAR